MRQLFYGEIPKPLEDDEIRKLFYMYKQGDLTAKKKIIIHNIRLIFSVINDFDVNDETKEILFSEGEIALINCVDNFDINCTNKFSTYARVCIKNSMLNYILRDSKKIISAISLNEPIGCEGATLEDFIMSSTSVEDDYAQKDMRLNILNILNSFDEISRDMLMMYYGFYGINYSYEEIGKKYGITKAGARYKIKNILKELKEFFSNNRNKVKYIG